MKLFAKLVNYLIAIRNKHEYFYIFDPLTLITNFVSTSMFSLEQGFDEAETVFRARINDFKTSL